MSRMSNGGRIGIALAFVLMVTVQLPGSSGVAAQDAPANLVKLSGTGSSEVLPLMTEWARPVYDSPTPIDLGYMPKGDRDARLKFSRGESDFVITGRPLDDEDRANLAERQVGAIEAPIAVSAVTFLQSGPARRPLSTDQVAPGYDPEDPDAPRVVGDYLGPLRMPHRLVARTLLEGGDRVWTDPELTALFAPLSLNPPRENPKVILRSDAGAMNYYVEQYLNTVAKDQWDAKLTNAGLEPGIVSEDWPLLSTPTRTGDDAIGVIIGSGNEAGGNLLPVGGALAPVSQSAATRQIALQLGKTDAANPPVTLYPLNIPNGNGEWIAPSPESISLAAAAGNGTPLYGLTEPVPGAYPLTWITSLIAPSTGLTPEKASALGATIRYAVTAGQAATAPLGEGHLPAPQVELALQAADRVVESNCKGSDRRLVTVDGGGPYWPPGVAAPARSTVCEAVVVPGETTTTAPFLGPANTQTDLVTPPPTVAAPSYVPPVVSGSGFSRSTGDSSYSGEVGPVDVAVESVVETPETTAPPAVEDDADQLNVSSVAAQLPLAMPGDGRFGLDRLVTAALGGAAFLVIRGLLRKRIGGVST